VTGTCTSIQFESKRISEFQEIDFNQLTYVLNRQGFDKKPIFGGLMNNFPILEKLIELINLSSGIPTDFNMEQLFSFFVDN